jgi:hypothetical protein
MQEAYIYRTDNDKSTNTTLLPSTPCPILLWSDSYYSWSLHPRSPPGSGRTRSSNPSMISDGTRLGLTAAYWATVSALATSSTSRQPATRRARPNGYERYASHLLVVDDLAYRIIQAYHDMSTYDVQTGTGGLDGSIQFELSRPEVRSDIFSNHHRND